MRVHRFALALPLAALALVLPAPAGAECLPDDPDCAAAEKYLYPNVRCNDATLRTCVETLSADGTVYDWVHFGSRCELYVNGKRMTPYLCYGP